MNHLSHKVSDKVGVVYLSWEILFGVGCNHKKVWLGLIKIGLFGAINIKTDLFIFLISRNNCDNFGWSGSKKEADI